MLDIVRKLEARVAASPSSLQQSQDRELRLRVVAENVGDGLSMKKRAVAYLDSPVGSTWEIQCDEGAYLGGEDSAPSPLAYFSSAIAFWLLTQLSRYGKIAKIQVDSIRLEQVTRFFMRGSALAGTMHGGGLGVETTIQIESSESPERVRQLVKMGEQTCFTLQSLIHPVPTQTAVVLNGQPLEFEAAAG